MAGPKFCGYEAGRKLAYLENRMMNMHLDRFELDRMMNRERELPDGYESESDSEEAIDEEMPSLIECACMACMQKVLIEKPTIEVPTIEVPTIEVPTIEAPTIEVPPIEALQG